MGAMTDAPADSAVEEEAPWGWKTDENGDRVPREKPGRPRVDKRKPRKRSIAEGRITTLGTPALGRCVEYLAAETGIMPTTFARMLIVEALKERGWPMKRINDTFGQAGDISEAALARAQGSGDE